MYTEIFKGVTRKSCCTTKAMDGRHWGTRVRPYIDRTAVVSLAGNDV